MGFFQSSPARGRRLRRAAAALAGTAGISLLFGAGVAAAAPGSLVSSFGTNGSVLQGLGPIGRSIGGDVAVASNGDIYQVGSADTSSGGYELYIARYLPGGTLDKTFGTAGVTYENVGAGTPASTAITDPHQPDLSSSFIALAADGDPVVLTDASTATGNEELAVFEFTQTGQLDTSFGPNSSGSYETTLGGSSAVPGGIAIDASGNIVLTGAVADAAGDEFFATRLSSSGAPESLGSSGSGLFTMALPGAELTVGTSVIAQSNGDLVFSVVGVTPGQLGQPGLTQVALTRLSAAGVADGTFGNGGTAPVGSFATPNLASFVLPASAAAAGGGYAVAYTAVVSTTFHATVAQLNSAGQLDTSFGSSGTMTLSTPLAPQSVASGLVAEGDGKLLLTGARSAILGNTPPAGPFVARLNSDGSIDSSFADDGVSANPIPATEISVPYDVTATADGNLVLSGVAVPTTKCNCSDVSLLQEVNLDTAPTLTFSYAPNSAQAGTPVQFAATAAANDGYKLGQVSWDFGTGSFGAATGNDVTHTFTSPGTYTVRAEVTDSYGLTTVSTQTITVAAPTSPIGGGGGGGSAPSIPITPTVPSTPTTTPTVTPQIHPIATLRLLWIRAGHGRVTVRLSCTGAGCHVSSRLTTLEHLVAGRTASLSASGHGKHTRTVTIGSLKLTLQAGATRTYTIRLNKAGRRLLAHFHKIPANGSFTLTNSTPTKTTAHTVTIG